MYTAVYNLAKNNDQNSIQIAEAGAIPGLVNLLKNGTEDQKEHACGALRNLAKDDQNRTKIENACSISDLQLLRLT